MSYETILWPTDGSENALGALQTAIDLAQTFGARLYVLHVVARVPMLSKDGFVPPTPMSFDVPRYEEELGQEMRNYLEKVSAEHVPAPTEVEHVILKGNPAEMILDFVRRNKVDLIVMSTQGRKGISHMFLGSVAERVIRRSPVPVLAVPAAIRE